MTALLFAVASALAWKQLEPECGLTSWPNGTTSATYRINTNDFTNAEIVEIELAAEAWRAGAGQVLRGANWALHRGANIGNDGNFNSGDGVNVVARKASTFFSSAGVPAATHVWSVDCQIQEFDTFLNADPVFDGAPVTWSTDLPSELGWASASERSIGQVMVHEFGHGVGLDHDDNGGGSQMLAVMNTYYPAGGDVSAIRYRISEDDFVGLADLHAGPSTGRNIMVTKFTNEYYVSAGESREGWTHGEEVYAGNLWCNVAGGYQTASLTPTMPTLLMTGTGGSVSVNMKWRLNTPGTGCNGGDEYTIASRDYDLIVNTPFRPAEFNWTLPSGVPVGNYELCAVVDVENDVVETVELLDNNIYSDETYRIVSTLADCF